MLKKRIDIGQEDVRQRIQKLIVNNPYALTFGIVFTFLFLNYKIGSLADYVEETMERNSHFIKESLEHPIILSASGMVITADRTPITYADQRFKDYVQGVIVNNLVAGLVKVTKGKSMAYASTKELVYNYKPFRNIVENFAGGNISVIYKYADAVRLAILENKLPEYIEIVDTRMERYAVRSLHPEDTKDRKKIIRGSVHIATFAKSYIPYKQKWQTRRVEISVPFEVVVDASRYGSISNPFGLNFNMLEMTAILK